MLKANGHREIVMIDASHSNSHKICREQINVVNNICEQVSGGNSSIIGVMIESNLVEGNQKIEPDKPLVYGQSVTDACLGWDDTVVLLNNLAHAVRDRRSRLQ
jgi:3-deoxy-7-phosphoheptulonate synthase